MSNLNIIKKNILVITDSYFPKNNSGAIMLGDFIKFSKLSFNFIIITFNPDIKEKYSIKIFDDQIIIYLKVWKNNNYLTRFLSESLYSYKIINFFKHNSFINLDYIVTYSPSIFFGKSINYLKKIYSCKNYLIQRDIFPDWAFKQGLIKSNIIYKYLKKIEKNNYNSADHIGVESTGGYEYLIKNGFNNVEILNNWIANNKTIEKTHKKIKYKTKYIYAGNLGIAQDFYSLLKNINFAELQKNNIQIIICGGGKQISQITNFIKELPKDTIKYIGDLNREDYLKELYDCDAGLVSLSIKTYMSNYPFKFIDYIRNDIPIIAHINKNNELKKFIEINQIGLCSDDSSYDEFNKNLILMTKKNITYDFKKNCKKTFEKFFSIERAFKVIESKLK